MAAIRVDDLVVTPSGRRATVRSIDLEGFAEIVYVYSPQCGVTSELGTVHARLLKRVSVERLKRLVRK